MWLVWLNVNVIKSHRCKCIMVMCAHVCLSKCESKLLYSVCLWPCAGRVCECICAAGGKTCFDWVHRRAVESLSAGSPLPRPVMEHKI